MKGTTEEIRKVQKQAVAMKLNGQGWKEIMAKTGLTHSQCDLAWYEHQAREEGTFTPEFAGWNEQRQYEWILARRVEGLSWGRMHAMTTVPESRIRTIFEKNSKIASTGLRTGKGGRFWANEPRYYTENHKGIGIEHAPGERPDPEEAMAKAEKAKSLLAAKVRRSTKRIKTTAAKAKEEAKAEAKQPEANTAESA